MEYYTARKRNEACHFCSNMDGIPEMVTLSEVSLDEKDKYLILLTCGI